MGILLIILFGNFAFNFFLVRACVQAWDAKYSWYVVLGMVVLDLGKATSTVVAMDPFKIFLFTVAGMVGSVVGRNEGVKKSQDSKDEPPPK